MEFFRLLVIKPSSMGDIVHGLQVVAALREQRPDVHVTWVVARAFATVVKASDVAQETIIFHRQNGLCGLISCCRAIRHAGRFGAVWDMQGLLRSGLMTLCARSPRKIGRSDSREGSFLCYGKRIHLPPRRSHHPPHAVEILQEFLPTLGAKRSFSPIHFRGEPFDWPGLDRPYVLLAPESRGLGKNWPHYEAMTAELCRGHPRINFLWVGVGNKSVEKLANFANFTDLQGKTTIGQLLSLIQNSRGVIANDSGCTHLSAAMGRPTLALFTTTDPSQSGPFPLQAPHHFVARNPPIQFAALDRFMAIVQKQR
jgi:ADP-heptose:LPS heptosyltransferase